MNTAVSTLPVADVKQLIDARLTDYCKVRTHTAGQVSERYLVLWESISRLLQAGGKRFRPYMVIAAFDAYAPDQDIEAIIPAALAQELLHSAMLIHDDIIDRDTIRYSVKNVTGQYDDHYAPFLHDPAERLHMTQSSALLAGDVLLSDAYRLLSKVDRPAELTSKAITIFSNSVFDVIGGELLDTESGFLPAGSTNAQTIAHYKTASYSFTGPLTMGATLAGAGDDQINLLSQFSDKLGVAYQLRDDLLGVFGDETTTGKSTSTDIKEGKRTYLIEQFIDCATERQKEAFFEIFHNSQASDQAVQTARTILQESGAKARVEERIQTLAGEATHLVGELLISDDSKATFYGLVEHCLSRKS